MIFNLVVLSYVHVGAGFWTVLLVAVGVMQTIKEAI